MKKTQILFLCTGNSIRSQIAEGYLRRFGGNSIEAWSAGVSPSGIHRLTIQVLEEDGIDISDHRSKPIDEIPLDCIDYVITLCNNAKDRCPSLPAHIQTEHWPIDDPVNFIGSEDKKVNRFRRTRDEIRGRVLEFLKQSKIKLGQVV